MTVALAPTAQRQRGIQHYGSIGLDFRPMPQGKKQRTSAIDAVVEGLKREPGRFAAVEENAHSRACAVKWRQRGCETRTFPSETTPGLFDVYARWPEGD